MRIALEILVVAAFVISLTWFTPNGRLTKRVNDRAKRLNADGNGPWWSKPLFPTKRKQDDD